MGAWTTRIFDDDGAADIRAEYKILLGYGIPPQESYKRIEDYFYKNYKEKDNEDVYWLSIALFQWKNGILMDKVKKIALQCLEDESYLEHWKESGEKVYKKRKEVLETLKEKLLYEVNPPREKFPKCPKMYRTKTSWKVGDLFAYRILRTPVKWEGWGEYGHKLEQAHKMLWNKYVILRVVEVSKHPVSKIYPELDYQSNARMMLYDWIGEKLPSVEAVSELSFRPIAVDQCKGIWRVASGVSLDCNVSQKEKTLFEITYLGNDKQFIEEKPELYRENSGCPWEMASQFDTTLILTFALDENVQTQWHY